MKAIKKTNSLEIENSELQNYFTTLTKSEKDFEVKIPVTNYQELGSIIDNLIGVCRSASILLHDNSQMNDHDKETFLGSSNLSISNVLELVQNLIPFAEFELLGELQSKINNEIPTN